MKELSHSFPLLFHQLRQLGDGHNSTVVLVTHIDETAVPRSTLRHGCRRLLDHSRARVFKVVVRQIEFIYSG
jgi:hypothetical protein